MCPLDDIAPNLAEVYLGEADTAADDLVKLVLTEQRIANPQAITEYVFKNADQFVEFLSPIQLALSDLDVDAWNTGQRFYDNHKAHIGVGLSVVSLPLTFISPEGESLVETGFLAGDCTETICKRIAQTQMFVDLAMAQGNAEFDYKNKPVYAAVKLRIIHALARKKIKYQKSSTDVEPINHFDSATALSLFHAAMIKFIKANKIKHEKSDAEAYFYRWHVMGKMMGIPDELNPETFEAYNEDLKPQFDARFFADFENNKHFEQLINGLIKALLRISFGNALGSKIEPLAGSERLQKWFFYFVYTVKPEAADFLPVPKGKGGKLFLQLLHTPRLQHYFDTVFHKRLTKYLGENYRFKHD